jgi:tRNA 2-thiouridine synthesizing protein A
VSETPVIVDARGLLCPWPALRLARAARAAARPARLRLLADDPGAPREIGVLCAEQGWELQEGGAGIFEIALP